MGSRVMRRAMTRSRGRHDRRVSGHRGARDHARGHHDRGHRAMGRVVTTPHAKASRDAKVHRDSMLRAVRVAR